MARVYPFYISIKFKSFENLFKILPVGVISKYKFIGANITLSIISSCNFVVAFLVNN